MILLPSVQYSHHCSKTIMYILAQILIYDHPKPIIRLIKQKLNIYQITNVKPHTIKTPANVKRNNADSITSCDEAFISSVKKDKGEHAIQHIDKFFSIFFILT